MILLATVVFPDALPPQMPEEVSFFLILLCHDPKFQLPITNGSTC